MQLPWWALQAPKDLKLRIPFQNPDNPSLFPTFQTANAIATSKQFSLQFPTHQATDSISTAKNYSFNFLNIKEKIPFQHPNNSGFNILHIKQSIPFNIQPTQVWFPEHQMGSQTSYQTINYELLFHHPTYLTSFLHFKCHFSIQLTHLHVLHIKCHFNMLPTNFLFAAHQMPLWHPNHLHFLHIKCYFNRQTNPSSLPTHQLSFQPIQLIFSANTSNVTSICNQPISIPHTLNGISLTYKQPIFNIEHVVKSSPCS